MDKEKNIEDFNTNGETNIFQVVHIKGQFNNSLVQQEFDNWEYVLVEVYFNPPPYYGLGLHIEQKGIYIQMIAEWPWKNTPIYG